MRDTKFIIVQVRWCHTACQMMHTHLLVVCQQKWRISMRLRDHMFKSKCNVLIRVVCVRGLMSMSTAKLRLCKSAEVLLSLS